MGRFVASKKSFWGILELFSMIKKVLQFVLICFNQKIAIKWGLIAWWDRFRFGCKTLKGVF